MFDDIRPRTVPAGYCSTECHVASKPVREPAKRNATVRKKGTSVKSYVCAQCGARFQRRTNGIREILNTIPLCAGCHTGWHRRRVVLHREIFTREEWVCISSAPLLGQNVAAWLDERYPPRP